MAETQPQSPDAPLALESRTADPRSLKLLDRNARHMSARQFNQLVENIRRDGVLTSAPLCAVVDDELVVLSGNHRTKAAVAAGLALIPILVVMGELSEARRVGIQLAHNALTGEDDQNLLRELYESLDVLGQRYSGLTDHSFGMLEDLDLSKLSLGQPTYQQVQLMFLPEDREVFIDAMEKLGKGAAKTKRFMARMIDFEQFEQALVAVQDSLDIRNQALAVLTMSQLALERLEQLESGNADDTGEQSSLDAIPKPSAGDEKGSGARPTKRRRRPSDRGGNAESQSPDDLPDGSKAP